MRRRYYNQFHLRGAVHVPLDQVQAKAKELHFEPANTVFVTMSNDEAAATEAWKILRAESVPNIYILEGGINAWFKTYAGNSLDNVEQGLQPAGGSIGLQV